MLSSDNFLNCVLNGHNLFSNHLNFFNLVSNVRNLLYDFLNFSIDNNFLLNSQELEWLRFNRILDDNLFNDSWNLDNLFDDLVHWYKFFNNSINWHWDLNWYDDLSLYFNDFRNLDVVVDDLFDRDVSWNLLNNFDNLLLNSFMIDYSLLNGLKFNEFINNLFNDLFNLDVDILLNDYFLDSVLNDGNLNDFLNLLDSFLNHDLRNNSFNNLWYLYNFFNDSWNHNYFLNNLFNLNNFRDLDHLFDNLFNWHLDLLNSINVS